MSPVALLWFVAGCMMLQPLSTDLYLASLPHLITYFSSTSGAVQQTLTLFVLGFGTSQLIAGPLSDRFGRRITLLGGIGIYILASMACAAAPALGWLIVARLIQAIGCCTGIVVARAIVRDLYVPVDSARVMAKASSLNALAPILGPILGSYLQVGFGWRAAFVVNALIGLVLGVVAWRWLRETNIQPNRNATRIDVLTRNYVVILRNPVFWSYALPGALSYGSIFVFISGSSYVLISVLSVPTEYYGYCFGVGVVGFLTGTLICRRLLAKRDIDRVLEIGTIFSAFAGLTFFVLVQIGLMHWSIVVVCIFLTMCAHGINLPITMTGAAEPFPEKTGAAVGLFGFLTMMTAFLVGVWVGFSQNGTLHPLSQSALILGLLLLLTARWLAVHRKRQP